MTLSANDNSSLNLEQHCGSIQLAAARIQAGYRGYRVRKQLKRLSKTKSNNKNKTMAETSNNYPDAAEKSATKIQAGVRGFLVRRKQNKAKEAATKIQAGFRGFKVRKDIKKINA